MTDSTAADPPSERGLDRRAVVRRTAAVLAGTAGLLAAPGLAGTASADSGDTLTAGGANDASDAQTKLTGHPTAATLVLTNTRVRGGEAFENVDVVAPQLRLGTPVPGAARPQVPDVASLQPGDVAAAGGLLYFGADVGNYETVPVQVHTSAFSNYFQPVPAGRAMLLDTKSGGAAVRDTLGEDNVDAKGRVAANRRIPLDLRSIVDTRRFPSGAAVAVQITAHGADSSGAVTAYASENANGVHVLHFTVLPAGVTANGAPFPIPASGGTILSLDAGDRLWFSVTGPTHLRLVVTGLLVPDPAAIVEPSAPGKTASGAVKRRFQQRKALRSLTAKVTPPK